MPIARHDYTEWYQRNHLYLQQAGLWLRGGELNTLPASEYDQRPFRVLFTRLSSYQDTAESFTHQLLYQIAAGLPGIYPDLAYLPPRGDVELLARDRIPWLLGSQSKLGPEAFDLIGFSNSVTQELINVPTFLEKSGIPLRKSERLERPEVPLIILGGANALYSSVLWLDDPLIDAIFVGEADQALKKILETTRDLKAKGASKKEILLALEEIPGFFQPDRQPDPPGQALRQIPRQIRRSLVADLNEPPPSEAAGSPASSARPVPHLPESLGSAALQISEGCPCFCSFCAESWGRKPYRERSARALKETALWMKASMGLDSVDLYGFNFNMHSELYEVLWDLIPNFRQIGMKSQRFDLLAHDPELLKFLQILDKTSLTCGLEGISPRLRAYLSKNLETEELRKSLAAIFRNKARELKIFLIATGLEQNEDFEQFSALLREIRELRMATGAGTRLIFSMTPLVRFPWTPLEFEAAYPEEHFKPIVRKTSSLVQGAGFEFREAAELPEYWVSQILVRADRPGISRAFLSAVAQSGFVYYREIFKSFSEALKKSLQEQGVDPGELLRGFDLEESRGKPWARIETGVKREFLWERALLARSFREDDYCLGRSWKKPKCFHCGACPSRFHVRGIVLARQARKHTLEQFRERRRRAQQTERKMSLLLHVGPNARGLPRKAVGVAVARALMLSTPELTPHYRGYESAFWGDADNPVWITGGDSVSLRWNEEALPLLQERMGDPHWLERVNAELGNWGAVRGLLPGEWKPRRLRITTPFELRLDDYLKHHGLKYTLRKDRDGAHLYELIPQSLKKGMVGKIRKERTNGTPPEVRLEIELGPKFRLPDFLEEILPARKDGHASAQALCMTECLE